MRLIPAILTDDPHDYERRIRWVETRSHRAQVDFMDGLFAHSTTLSVKEAAAVTTIIELDAHLMVTEPLSYVESLAGSSFTRVFIHYEAVSEHRALLARIKDAKMKAGLALNPKTPAEAALPLLGDIDALLVLGVDPAARDTVFDYKVLDKVSRIKKMAGGLECGVDGGVTLDNLDAVIEAGPDFICAGSAIFGSSEPGKALAEFSRRISAAVG